MSAYVNRKLFVLAGLACLSQVAAKSASPPASVDWRSSGIVTPVKNQGKCNSSYVFATTALIESALIKKRLFTSINLSEQQALDCTSVETVTGCKEGNPADLLMWLIKNGSVKDADYPYVSGGTMNHGSCRVPRGSISLKDFTFLMASEPDESILQLMVAQHGPSIVFLDASLGDFKAYKGGIYDNPKCSPELHHLNQAVLLVGYGSENGKPYWILKNSWGTSWGEGGYMRLARGDNRCGILTGVAIGFQ